MQNWIKESSANKPSKLDFTSSKDSVIQRRNITEKTRQEEDSQIVEYECEMRFLTPSEWEEIKTDVLNSEVKVVFSPEEIDYFMSLEIETQKSVCEEKIFSGMVSECLGIPKTFSTSMNNQATIQGLVLTAIMNKSGMASEVLEHKAIDEIDCYPWTEDQIIQLGVDLKKHITSCKKEAELKINAILAKYTQ